MSQITFTVNSIKDIFMVAEKIFQLSYNNRVFLFYGEMGSGKTTLIKHIVTHFGIVEANSPTFSIINTYLGRKKQFIYHIDCYRIENENEIENVGLLEILYGENLCFIEWPEKIHNFLPNNYVRINIEIYNRLRKIIIET